MLYHRPGNSSDFEHLRQYTYILFLIDNYIVLDWYWLMFVVADWCAAKSQVFITEIDQYKMSIVNVKKCDKADNTQMERQYLIMMLFDINHNLKQKKWVFTNNMLRIA